MSGPTGGMAAGVCVNSGKSARHQRLASVDAVAPAGVSSADAASRWPGHMPARGHAPFLPYRFGGAGRGGAAAPEHSTSGALAAASMAPSTVWAPPTAACIGAHVTALRACYPPRAGRRPRPDTDLDATSWQACPDVFSFRTRSFLRASERGRRGPSAVSHSMNGLPAPARLASSCCPQIGPQCTKINHQGVHELDLEEAPKSGAVCHWSGVHRTRRTARSRSTARAGA